MSKNDKTSLNLFVRTIMPDLYEIQKMWNCWDDSLKSIADNSCTSDTNLNSFQEENQSSSEQKEDAIPSEE